MYVYYVTLAKGKKIHQMSTVTSAEWWDELDIFVFIISLYILHVIECYFQETFMFV
jgi:hypothetical protein